MSGFCWLDGHSAKPISAMQPPISMKSSESKPLTSKSRFFSIDLKESLLSGHFVRGAESAPFHLGFLKHESTAPERVLKMISILNEEFMVNA
jgi:hypothetical protein